MLQFLSLQHSTVHHHAMILYLNKFYHFSQEGQKRENTESMLTLTKVELDQVQSQSIG